MRFITFATTILFGRFLATGICVAKPISVRRGSISEEEIVARAFPGQRVTTDARPRPEPQLVWVPGVQPLAEPAAQTAEQAVIKFLQSFDSERVGSQPKRRARPSIVFGAPAVSSDGRIWFKYKPNGPAGEVFTRSIVWPIVDPLNSRAEIFNSRNLNRHVYRTPPSGHD
ncbi:hypothetical protein BDP27DRAFT_1517546 [Rhodocollybia butyracea]|uniref:Uncharacterized protein n=1 Tax=Rhodocollybia butyracea TaxID=206335 RepID=A0A9P5TWZ0_9AGAR|nr:hypothetical protein BDP27DRAFT_1517546 [Rhodocollybia butyracea]